MCSKAWQLITQSISPSLIWVTSSVAQSKFRDASARANSLTSIPTLLRAGNARRTSPVPHPKSNTVSNSVVSPSNSRARDR